VHLLALKMKPVLNEIIANRTPLTSIKTKFFIAIKQKLKYFFSGTFISYNYFKFKLMVSYSDFPEFLGKFYV
jgi:hypothetical protein